MISKKVMKKIEKEIVYMFNYILYMFLIVVNYFVFTIGVYTGVTFSKKLGIVLMLFSIYGGIVLHFTFYEFEKNHRGKK